LDFSAFSFYFIAPSVVSLALRQPDFRLLSEDANLMLLENVKSSATIAAGCAF